MAEHRWIRTQNVVDGRQEHVCRACQRIIGLFPGEPLPAHNDGGGTGE